MNKYLFTVSSRFCSKKVSYFRHLPKDTLMEDMVTAIAQEAFPELRQVTLPDVSDDELYESLAILVERRKKHV